MAAAGQQAEQALADVMREYKGNYIVAVEGNAPLNEDGMFCILAGEPFPEKLKRVSADAKAIIAGVLRIMGLRAGSPSQPN